MVWSELETIPKEAFLFQPAKEISQTWGKAFCFVVW